MSNYNDFASVLIQAAIGMATNNGTPASTLTEVAQAAIAAATKNIPTTSTATATNRRKADFNDINELLKNHWGGSYYYGNAIPEKKLRNARAAMGIPSTKKIYALYDNTIFGSAKEGACFTDNEIYGRTSSSSEVLTYDDLTKKTITYSSSGYLRFNDVPTVFSAWFDSLLVKLNRVNAPVDTTKAIEAIKQGKFAQCIKYLDDEEAHVKYTQPQDLFLYRKLYIEANIAMLKMDTATTLLNTLRKNQGTNKDVADYIADTEKRISEYKVQYDNDVNELNKTLELCEKLCSEDKFEEALELLEAVSLRDDFTKKIKREYYKTKIATYLRAEKPDKAEETIADLFEKEFIDSNEKTALDKQVYELRETLHRRFLQEQRELITKRIETAKMYEKYEIYESASDTILAALSDAPKELNVERVNLFKMLADMLMTQYEYDDLYAIAKQYSDVTSSDKLGYALSERIEEHKAAHAEEYFDHLYSGLLYYMQNGKLERAQRYLDNAKEIKSTFDLRCSEVNLSLLKLDYIESRNLIDSLIADKSMFDTAAFDEAIEQLEAQYDNMIFAISDMLKSYALSNNIEALMEKHGYRDFVDGDGLNVPCIAARSANHKILDSLLDYGYGYEFRRTNEGFGIAFLAAMQVDYEAFAEFINARMDSFDGDINCVLNEKMDYGFAVSEVTRDLRAANGIGELEARDIAIRGAYNEAILLMAVLLDDAKRAAILAMLSERKSMQETKAAQMREALPSELQRIDNETKEKCTSLRTASSELVSLISDVPEDEDSYRLNSVVEELNDAVKAANDFARANAEQKKAAKKAALENAEGFVNTIQSRITAFEAIDSSEILSLLAIPAASIQLGEYNEENQTLAFTLGDQIVEVEMSSQFAELIISHSDKVQVSKGIKSDFDGCTFTVVYDFTYSDGENSCTVSFTKETEIDESLTEDKFVDRILGLLKN